MAGSTKAAVGQGLLLAVLVLGGFSLILIQTEPQPWPMLSHERLFWAMACIATYIAGCAGLYLHRRRVTAASRHQNAGENPLSSTDASVLDIAFASQTGFAEALAQRTASTLRGAGMRVRWNSIGQLTSERLAAAKRLLFIVSTTGEGDAPDSALAFMRDVMSEKIDLSGSSYGLLSLGDRSYANFCGFGRALEFWLRRHGARPLFDAVEVDDGDPAALRHWQHHLSVLAGRTDLPDWAPPRYSDWPLLERTLLNPGSQGEGCYHVALAMPPGMQVDWQAGDIVEIGPRNAPERVKRILARFSLDGAMHVDVDGTTAALADLLSRSVLPDDDVLAERAWPELFGSLTPLPHREYSIASLPQDGRLELLVRQMRRPDGRIGIGSGWLTEHAAIGSGISARVRRNTAFHAPSPGTPMILIGNGTGLAGLRAHLKARVAAGERRNWLLFGERNADRDFFFREDIEQWHREGRIERLDLAFSRDPPVRRYVQECLRDARDELKRWLDDGAAIYVCGSLSGMAPGVHAVLADAVGEDCLIDLAAAGRYRRDVY